jgi:putative heme-binding domain-containing protein
VSIELADGEDEPGVVQGDTAHTPILRDSSAREHRLPRASIQARRNSSLSLMPEGLHAGLTPEEFADLIAFLASLKAPNPEP